MWVGIDDTDSPSGGCTTWVLTEIIRQVTDLDLIGYPRLVRLNPNVPFKTRGNAALSARFGHGRGNPRVIGRFVKGPIRSFPSGTEPSEAEAAKLFETTLRVLRKCSMWGDEGTDPAVVISPRTLPHQLYWNAVRRMVSVGDAVEAVSSVPGAFYAAYGDGRGLVGAASSLSWGAGKRTWEAITYRPRTRWGTKRRVDTESVKRMARDFPETFLSWDERTRRVLVTPHTPCPILFGIRSRSPTRLAMALRRIGSEPIERWMIFETNQGTGDHLAPHAICEIEPDTSPVLKGVVESEPKVRRGGHVWFGLSDGTGEVTCMAFEPTKTLPRVVRRLHQGDKIVVWGSIPGGSMPRVLRLEGIRVIHLAPVTEKRANPACPDCGRRTNSMGSGKGFRCPICRTRLPPESAERTRITRSGLLGTHLPTPSARRHLSPLRPTLPIQRKVSGFRRTSLLLE